MKVIYDVKCPSGHQTEVYAELDATHRCKCGKAATRVRSAPKTILDPLGGFPGAEMKWEKQRFDNGD